jgi:hypothetical protein
MHAALACERTRGGAAQLNYWMDPKPKEVHRSGPVQGGDPGRSAGKGIVRCGGRPAMAFLRDVVVPVAGRAKHVAHVDRFFAG